MSANVCGKYKLKHQVRVVTATSLFDGHDAAINIMRRLVQMGGAEVIHLGHNRSVAEIVEAAIQEDVQAVAVSSYQGGHNEFFRYMRDMLVEQGAPHVRIFGGGGGVIRPDEIADLQGYGVERIYDPEDGRHMGLLGMIDDLLARCDFHTINVPGSDDESGRGAAMPDPSRVSCDDPAGVARLITLTEMGGIAWAPVSAAIRERAAKNPAPVVGFTGTGGSGKSSLLDEIVRRFRESNPGRTVAVLSADPSKRRTGGALLGDRIRMNSVHGPGVYMRSLATRDSKTELPDTIRDAIDVVRAAGFDLVLVETSGIGQGDTAIVDVADVSVYVMTSEFGAPTQLEKIDMIDFADVIVINKYERKGSEDALRDVRRQLRRARNCFDVEIEQLPVYGTIASKFNDEGVNGLYAGILEAIAKKRGRAFICGIPEELISRTSGVTSIIPQERIRYLGEIAETVRGYKRRVREQAEVARRMQHLATARTELGDEPVAAKIDARLSALGKELCDDAKTLLASWDDLRKAYEGDTFRYEVRGKEFKVALTSETLAGTKIPKVMVPELADHGDRLAYLMLENVPGGFPYTAGVFPFKREGEDPKRQFAGEGGPVKPNPRFHYLTRNDDAKRLSTAFDSVTLYGQDPDPRPDIFGKIGDSGVSICTIEDLKKLYAGFDLCAPATSVSMTINGPAPMMLAFFLNMAIDQQEGAFVAKNGRAPTPAERARIEADTLCTVRGTVQADILKEDQAQNTCIFSTDFALKMMGDIQEFFIERSVRNYYSVSISGYHIAEAGANPITQTAFTLANGFTYVEYYLSRGFPIDSFAPNLSFFFSNGMDAEYTVIGRVARRIWAVAMRDKYGAAERSQKLKYHIQTSGRSLHAQEIQFNDIRTTLQALLAFYDNCNSLHTNSYDEAITTPTEESVRRAMAIQMITLKEFGLTKNEHPWQGSYVAQELTELVEEAILAEFERLSTRGGVLGSMETQYQRGKIQDESMLYEHRKHTGELPIIGVNTYLNPGAESLIPRDLELRRATPEEKQGQISNLEDFKRRNAARCEESLKKLKDVALKGGNIFAQMMETARYASLGQISRALYEVGGQYRRSM
ncbi:MAG: methylmalonyl-CoA mutase family protein [Deltaproteobacteria bacterium]|nr:methylmalonyl-CoA mutase family protein [Deltaproteobacteria bacterium]